MYRVINMETKTQYGVDCLSIEEATAVHEREKRKAIRQVAEEYKQVIPDKVYKALLAW